MSQMMLRLLPCSLKTRQRQPLPARCQYLRPLRALEGGRGLNYQRGDSQMGFLLAMPFLSPTVRRADRRHSFALLDVRP